MTPAKVWPSLGRIAVERFPYDSGHLRARIEEASLNVPRSW